MLSDADNLAKQQHNMETQAKKERTLLYQRIRDHLYLTVCCNPINKVESNIEIVTQWVLNLLGSETHVIPPEPPVLKPLPEMLGLNSRQVFRLKHFYEAKTGKKAEDL